MHSPEIEIRLELGLWITAGLLALAFGVAGCGSEETKEAPPPPLPAERPLAGESMPMQPPALPAERPLAGESMPMEPPAPSVAERPDREEDTEDLAAAVSALGSRDPEERSAAILELEPDGPGLPYLLQVLSDDPDPEVRMEAVSQLGDGESPGATAGLISALDDPDPRVVIGAIDALELSADQTVIGSLEKLLRHPDADVREAAEDAIDFLD